MAMTLQFGSVARLWRRAPTIRDPASPGRRFVNVDPPEGRFWEGDNLMEYCDHLVGTILAAWRDLAPLVDEAVDHSAQRK